MMASAPPGNRDHMLAVLGTQRPAGRLGTAAKNSDWTSR